MSVFFDNRVIVAPQAASAIDDSLLVGINQPLGSTALLLIGPSTSGKPNSAAAFTSLSAFSAYFGSGPLVTAATRAFNPSASVSGPSLVYGIRAATTACVQGSYTYTAADGSGTPAALTLKTNAYGLTANRYQVKIATATNVAACGTPSATVSAVTTTSTAVAVKVTVQYSDITVVADNIGYNALYLNYTGANTTLTARVTPTQLILTSGAGGSENCTVDLATQNTLQAVIDYVSANATNWTIAFPNQSNTLAYTYGGGQLSPSSPSTVLDVTASTPGTAGVLTVAKLTPILLTAVNQATADWLNSANDPYFTATRNDGTSTTAINMTVPISTALGFKYAAGGADGSPASQNDYQTALDAAKTVDAGIVVAVTAGSATIGDTGLQSLHQMVDAHCSYMSGGGSNPQMERIQIAGPNSGKSLATVLNWASYLNSFRTALVWPGIQDNIQGVMTTLDPFYVAAQVGGMLSGSSAPTALTRKFISALGTEPLPTWSSPPSPTSNATGILLPADVDALLQGGVMPIQYVRGQGFRIAQSILTWTQSSNFDKREISVRRTADIIVRNIRDTLDRTYIGQLNGPLLEQRVLNTTVSILEQYVGQGWLVGDDTFPAYQNLTVSIPYGQPDVVSVTFEASVGVPANYILITANLAAYPGTVAPA